MPDCTLGQVCEPTRHEPQPGRSGAKPRCLDQYIRRDKRKGCLLWRGALTQQGQPTARLGGRPVVLKPHILRAYGTPAPTQHAQVEAFCRRRLCIAPEHLRWVPIGTAGLRRLEKIGRPRGEALHRSDLTEEDVREIRRRSALGADARWLAEQWLVSLSTVRRILRRDSWRHVK